MKAAAEIQILSTCIQRHIYIFLKQYHKQFYNTESLHLFINNNGLQWVSSKFDRFLVWKKKKKKSAQNKIYYDFFNYFMLITLERYNNLTFWLKFSSVEIEHILIL